MMGFEPWMGDSYYTNFGQLNPLTTLTSGFRQCDERMAAVEREAEELLRERYEVGRISRAEYDEALTHTGGHWTQALAEARESSDDQVGIETIARSFFSPNLLVDWAIKKYQGRETDIGHLPSTRTGGAIRSFTDGTFAEPVGELVQGALSAPELALRSKNFF